LGETRGLRKNPLENLDTRKGLWALKWIFLYAEKSNATLPCRQDETPPITGGSGNESFSQFFVLFIIKVYTSLS